MHISHTSQLLTGNNPQTTNSALENLMLRMKVAKSKIRPFMSMLVFQNPSQQSVGHYGICKFFSQRFLELIKPKAQRAPLLSHDFAAKKNANQ